MSYTSTCAVNFTFLDFNRNHCIFQFITGNTGVKTKILVFYRVNDQSLRVCWSWWDCNSCVVIWPCDIRSRVPFRHTAYVQWITNLEWKRCVVFLGFNYDWCHCQKEKESSNNDCFLKQAGEQKGAHMTYYWWGGQQQFVISIQLNFSSLASLGTEESGHCKEVDVVERFNPLTALPAKTGCTRRHCFKTLPELSLRGHNP